MVSDSSSRIVDSGLAENEHELLLNDKAEFIGSYAQKDGRICDYYLVSSDSEAYYYYILRSSTDDEE